MRPSIAKWRARSVRRLASSSTPIWWSTKPPGGEAPSGRSVSAGHSWALLPPRVLEATGRFLWLGILIAMRKTGRPAAARWTSSAWCRGEMSTRGEKGLAMEWGGTELAQGRSVIAGAIADWALPVRSQGKRRPSRRTGPSRACLASTLCGQWPGKRRITLHQGEPAARPGGRRGQNDIDSTRDRAPWQGCRARSMAVFGGPANAGRSISWLRPGPVPRPEPGPLINGTRRSRLAAESGPCCRLRPALARVQGRIRQTQRPGEDGSEQTTSTTSSKPRKQVRGSMGRQDDPRTTNASDRGEDAGDAAAVSPAFLLFGGRLGLRFRCSFGRRESQGLPLAVGRQSEVSGAAAAVARGVRVGSCA